MSSAKTTRESTGSHASDPVEVPHVLGLMWCLFAQPYRLRELLRALGVEPDLLPAEFRAKLSDSPDPRVRRLLTRLVLVPVPCLVLGVLLAGLVSAVLPPFSWPLLAAGVGVGLVAGAVMVLGLDPLRGLALAATLPPVLGLLLATSGGQTTTLMDRPWPALAGLLLGSFAVLMDAVRHCTSPPSVRRRVFDVARLALLGGALVAVEASQRSLSWSSGGLVFVLVALPTYGLGVLHLPFYIVAAISSLSVANTHATSPEQAADKARRLLFLRHDLLPFALPGMERILVDVARADPDLGRRLISRAAKTSGQAEAAEHALNELRARALVDVANERAFDRLLRGEEPFLSSSEGWMGPFFTAARDIQAARASRLHHNRGQRLEAALHTLRSEEERVVGIASVMPREHQQRLRVVSTWIDVVREELDRLEHDRRQFPQVPTPFVAGPVLREKDEQVFKGRGELVAKIEHFMAPERRGTMHLLGQRRMGKSSLMNMLPRLLGTGTRLLRLSFQGLSGEEHRAHPHLIVAEALHRSVGAARPRPEAAAWSHTLDWMGELDAQLGQRGDGGQQVLVAIDEVERVEDGIRAGWTDTGFLDFLRAAGDRLDHVRILMISAHPLHRIGPHWSDRLISVITIQIGYLEEEDARALCCPLSPRVFDFARLYPEGGIDRIVHETHRHPYLIQLVCDELCRHLNDQGRLRATDDDIKQAFDRALNKAKILFRQLWELRNEEERRLLSLLADKPRSLPPSEARSWLKDEGFIREAAVGFAVAVPMFARWIAEYTGDA